MGEIGKASGALAVLGINVAMLLVGGSLTLAAQRGLPADELEKARHREPLDARVSRSRHSLEVYVLSANPGTAVASGA